MSVISLIASFIIGLAIFIYIIGAFTAIKACYDLFIMLKSIGKVAEIEFDSTDYWIKSAKTIIFWPYYVYFKEWE